MTPECDALTRSMDSNDFRAWQTLAIKLENALNEIPVMAGPAGMRKAYDKGFADGQELTWKAALANTSTRPDSISDPTEQPRPTETSPDAAKEQPGEQNEYTQYMPDYPAEQGKFRSPEQKAAAQIPDKREPLGESDHTAVYLRANSADEVSVSADAAVLAPDMPITSSPVSPDKRASVNSEDQAGSSTATQGTAGLHTLAGTINPGMQTPAPAAPDVAAMVRRLRDYANESGGGRVESDLLEAAALIEKLGQWK